MNPADVKSTANTTSVVLVGTMYLVLYTTEQDATKWAAHKLVDARTPEGAIKAAIGTKIPDGAVQFVAIPARSWRPVKVTEKVERSLLVTEVKP